MAPTQNDIDTGAQALKDYVTSIDGWEASFVPWGTYEDGAQLVLQTWDSAAPAPTSDAATTGNAMRMAACGMALYQKISDAGYADRVTAQQCAAGASAILTATRLKGTADA